MRIAGVLAAAAALGFPSAASAALDRVVDALPAKARAAAATGRSYPVSSGGSVKVSFGSGAAEDAATAQSYVSFLDALPHGTELGSLSLLVVPASAIGDACGGGEGVLACYEPSTQTAVVPSEGLQTSASGVSTAYVLAHEYGHHVAAKRSNAPFRALDYGPKRWASYERVCLRSWQGLLAPGDESFRYLENPGEAWADTYAHLTFPDQEWQFTDLLRPDDGAYAAAREDVLEPWTHNVVRSFRATPAPTSRFSFTLRLDGALKLTLRGNRTSRYRLAVRASGASQGTKQTTGGQAVLSYAAACREADAERVTVTVTRLRGGGPVSLRVSYAG